MAYLLSFIRVTNLEISIKKTNFFSCLFFIIYTIAFNILKESNTSCYIKLMNKTCKKYASICCFDIITREYHELF